MSGWNCHQCGAENADDKVICAKCGAIKRVEIPRGGFSRGLFSNPGDKLQMYAKWFFCFCVVVGLIIMIVIWSAPIGHGFKRFVMGLGVLAGTTVLSYFVALLISGFGELICGIKRIEGRLDEYRFK